MFDAKKIPICCKFECIWILSKSSYIDKNYFFRRPQKKKKKKKKKKLKKNCYYLKKKKKKKKKKEMDPKVLVVKNKLSRVSGPQLNSVP